MFRSKIGYNLIAKTARQQYLIENMAICTYYESRFCNLLKDLNEFIGDDINYDISSNEKLINDSVSHSIVYQFWYYGDFEKNKIKKYIYEQINERLEKDNYYE